MIAAPVHRRMRNRDGFTIIEILIVVAVLGILIAALVPFIGRGLTAAEGFATSQKLRKVKSAIDEYRAHMSKYPNSLNDLIKSPSEERLAKKWKQHDKFLDDEEDLVDKWDQPLHYKLTPGGKAPYELYSEGDPGKPGNRIDA